ncbi:uncharacterized protein LOC143915560 [Arctopsyche grandis]|uniref:uncharacterized protein LOC143915479 n=1 Tax=Arctopsyche grandis TaxID=121162 RepID=UPI00406D88BD
MQDNKMYKICSLLLILSTVAMGNSMAVMVSRQCPPGYTFRDIYKTYDFYSCTENHPLCILIQTYVETGECVVSNVSFNNAGVGGFGSTSVPLQCPKNHFPDSQGKCKPINTWG